MQKLVKEYLDELDKRQKKNRKIHIAVLLLAVMVIGSVAGVLTQYGIAMTDKVKCGLEEHSHSEKCYENVLICEMAEGEGHTHTAECNYPEELICGKEESEGHTHSEECSYPEELVCGQDESEEHTHTEECYQVPEGYACGLEESEGHEHTEECYQVPEGYACGLEENEGHTHIETCYSRELTCDKEEHMHTDICYTDAAADVEDSSVWDSQYAAVEWKEIWGEDLVTAAQMQLGYQESVNNYIVATDGNHKGYTRYGQFAGNPYMDWDGAFVNFCIHYAGLEESGHFPAEADTAKWCEEFVKMNEENGAYLAAPAAYAPKAGDIIFFQKEGEETGSQMGIVSSCEAETGTLRVIEGNSGNEVRENEYNVNDNHIVSYLKISELEESFKGLEEETTEGTETEEAEETAEVRTMTAEGPDYTVTVSFTSKAQIPKEAVLKVEEIDQNSDAYREYYSQSLQAMDAEEISFARYFDVTFLVNGKEIEPSAPVDVKICYTDSIDMEEDASGNAVHFSKDGTEILDAGVDEEEHSFTFTQSSFSVVGTVVAKGMGACFYKGGVPEDLDGKTFLLETVWDAEHIFLTGAAAEKSDGTKGLRGSRTEGQSFVEEPEEEWLWTFHKVDETVYYIQNDVSGKFLNINGSDVTLDTEAVELTVETKTSSDLITVRRGRYFLDANDGQCIAASEKKTDSELESWNKFRLFGTGREYTLTAEGEDYRITLELTAPEGLLDNVGFTAEEITGETAELYSQKAQEALSYKGIGYQRFFHLEFDREIPEELIRISSVTIQYKDNAEGFDINGAIGVVQFSGNNGLVFSDENTENSVAMGISAQSDEISEEVLSAEINAQDNAISADISTLADVGTVWEATTGQLCYKSDIQTDEDLDGKDFLITCLRGTKLVMEAAEINLSNSSGTPGLRGIAFTGGDFVNRSASMTLWHFEKQSDGTFYISQKEEGSSAKNYIRITNNNNIRLSQEPQALTVTYLEDGRVAIQGDGKYINSYGSGGNGGFAGWSLDEGSMMTLYVYPDVNVSALEFEMESANLRGSVIADETNPDLMEKERITIKGKNPYINFSEDHPWPGITEVTGTKAKYGFSRVQIAYTEEGKERVRKIDRLHVRGSEEDGYVFVFFNNENYVGTFEPDQVKIQNGYRVIERLADLEVEPTISTKDKIQIRMIDYQTDNGQYNGQFSGWGWENSEAGRGVKQGVLTPYLDTNDYPSFTLSANQNTGWGEGDFKKFNSSYSTTTLESYFTNATDADYLFLKSKYEKEGYYEYKSTENGAVYDGTNFTVYKQLTAPKSDTSALNGKGQFLPYNTFNEKKLSVGQNLYTAQDLPLDADNERYGEELYVPDQAVNYHFGMELSTEFYQMKNGKVGNNPMIYEFSGDDDLWVYIDGVLVLDLGGCHDARVGHIDFSTGEVYVQGVGTTTLRQLFQNAYDTAVANHADSAIIAELNKKLADSNWNNGIFADYTKHDFKMWYMERGTGASNLEVRFNLPVIPAGEIQVEKRLSNSEQEKYANQLFGFQVYLQPQDASAGNVTDVFDENAEKEDYLLFNQHMAETLNAALQEGEAKVTASIEYQDRHREDDITIPTDGTFWLHPGDKLILNGLKANRGYFVRELNPNWDKYSGVTIDQITSSSQDGEGNEIEGDLLEITEDGDADVRIMKVSERSYVAFNNECSAKNRNELRIQKKMGYGESKGDTYEFRVWLEGHDGKLQLYEGNYYLIHDGETLSETTPKRTTDPEKPGIISGISPGDTVIIKELLADTRFLVEEINLGEEYDTPGYKVEYLSRNTDSSTEPEEVLEETEEIPDESLTEDEDSGTEMGTIPLDKDVQVTVTNNRLDESVWYIKKMSKTEGGPCLEAIFELASIPDGTTYYGKSSQEDGIIIWYSDRECTPANQISVRDIKTGTYQLQEIEAPPGYSLSDEIWTVTVKARCEVEITNQEPERNPLEGSVGNQITEYTYTFDNTPAYTLPDAGGRGIYWYLIGGVLSMMAGALILYRNKCREVQKS